MKFFKCKKSPLVIAVSIVVTLLLLFLGLQSVDYFGTIGFLSNNLFQFAGLVLAVAVVLIFFILSPVRLNLSATGELDLVFPFHKKHIPLKPETRVQLIHKIPVVDFGSRGYFGYLGLGMGGARVWVQDPKKMVAIHTDNQTFVVSCENPEEFVEAVNQKLMSHE